MQRCVQDSLSVRDAEYAASLWKEEGVFPWLHVADDHAEAQAHPVVPEADSLVRKPLPRKTKSPFLQMAQSRLRQDLKIRVSISGTETRGSISLSYQNLEELHTLLRRLGIDAPDPAGK